MSGALDDITVLDLTRGFPAALSAAFLADFGEHCIGAFACGHVVGHQKETCFGRFEREGLFMLIF